MELDLEALAETSHTESELERMGLKLQNHTFGGYTWYSGENGLYTFTTDDPVINGIILYNFESEYLIQRNE